MDMIKVLLTSLLSVVVLYIIAKVIGHKQLAQLDFFDYICGITIGSIGAELATELEEPLKPLIAILVYGVISVILGTVAHKFPKSRKYINGTPSILLDNGKLYRENMKKAKLELSELMMMCREQGYFDLGDIQTAVFEPTGKLSILPKSEKRPTTPEDIGVNVSMASINVEVIMDGRILDENLKRMGLDTKWLEKELRSQGYKKADEVFLGICDKEHKLTLFGKEA